MPNQKNVKPKDTLKNPINFTSCQKDCRTLYSSKPVTKYHTCLSFGSNIVKKVQCFNSSGKYCEHTGWIANLTRIAGCFPAIFLVLLGFTAARRPWEREDTTLTGWDLVEDTKQLPDGG
ncbi:hypothetical protein SUGI_1178450 [Cryptomeria japonica]|nr:hypothetical protein SUGI_1178450 [Cryptomeria japonica]